MCRMLLPSHVLAHQKEKLFSLSPWSKRAAKPGCKDALLEVQLVWHRKRKRHRRLTETALLLTTRDHTSQKKLTALKKRWYTSCNVSAWLMRQLWKTREKTKEQLDWSSRHDVFGEGRKYFAPADSGRMRLGQCLPNSSARRGRYGCKISWMFASCGSALKSQWWL